MTARPPFVEAILAPLSSETRAITERMADEFFARHGTLYVENEEAVRRAWEAARDNALDGDVRAELAGPVAPPQETQARSPDEWGEVIPLTSSDELPAFPVELLPGPLRDFVAGISVETQTPTALAAMIVLAVVAAAVARKVAVEVTQNWIEALCGYFATALPSANLKSPIFRLACAPFERWEEERAKAMRPEIAEAENKRENLKARLGAVRRDAAKAEAEVERRDLLAETDKLTLELESLPNPRAPQLIAGDVTEESLGRLLADNDGRIAVFSDEGGPFRNMAGRYQKDGAPIFEMFKHGHNAGTIRVNRMGREPVYVANAAITLGLMVQPSVLKGLVNTPEFRDQGLLARFIYAVPKSLLGERKWSDAEPCKAEVVAAYRSCIRSLLAMDFGLDQDGRAVANILRLSEAAYLVLAAFVAEREPRLGPSGDLAHVSDWAGKLGGTLVRLAGWLHLAARSETAEPWREPISGETMKTALTILRQFVIPHGLAAHAEMGAHPAQGLATVVIEYVRSGRRSEFTRRDLHKNRPGRTKEPAGWDPALQLLVDNGWLLPKPEPEGKDRSKGGRPSGPAFLVNPFVLRDARDKETP